MPVNRGVKLIAWVSAAGAFFFTACAARPTSVSIQPISSPGSAKTSLGGSLTLSPYPLTPSAAEVLPLVTPPPGSGVWGFVMMNPACGSSCAHAAFRVAARVSILTNAGSVVGEGSSSRDRPFLVGLKPGIYTLQARVDEQEALCSSKRVAVEGKEYSFVLLGCDPL